MEKAKTDCSLFLMDTLVTEQLNIASEIWQESFLKMRSWQKIPTTE